MHARSDSWTRRASSNSLLDDPRFSCTDIYTSFDGGAELTARGVSHSVNTGCDNKGSVDILHDVSLQLPAGDFCGVLGPSGAGKTTLVNLLRSGNCTSGELLFDGQRYTPSARRHIAVIPQDDVLLAGLSPTEMLMYTAALRMRGVSPIKRQNRVRAVLDSLRFSERDRHTRIGNVERRGLSGGQRKRVSIGLELLSSPRALLCDEPSSGLDSALAWDVVQLLRQLAGKGYTVVATMHQPSWRVVSTFKSLVLLSSGGVAYAGRSDAALPYFSSLGCAPPPLENPADHWMMLLQEDEAKAEAGGPQLSMTPTLGSAPPAPRDPSDYVPTALVAAWHAHLTKQPLDREESASPATLSPARQPGAPPQLPRAKKAEHGVGFVASSLLLLQRSLHDGFKDPRKVARMLGLKLMIGFLVGIIWLNEGRTQSFKSIFTTTGALFLVVNNAALDVLLETVLHFPLNRALLRREWLNGTYSLPAYFASTVLFNLVTCTLNALLLACPVYALVGFTFDALHLTVFVSALCLMALIGGAVGLIVGCFCDDIQSARAAAMPTLVPLLIFSGYVLPLDSIPPYFKWLYYGSFFAYSFSILQINELSGRVYTQDCPMQLAEAAIEKIIHQKFPHLPLPAPGATNCTGDGYLEQAGLYPVAYGGLSGYFAILAAYCVLVHLAAFCVLRWRASRMHNE